VRAMQVIGECNGSGRIVLKDPQAPPGTPTPVDLDLETVLGDLPQKSYAFEEYSAEWAQPLALPDGEPPATMLQRVLRMAAVGSKRFLTTKVDRCVTGLVAQQQCVGALQLPIADVAVIAQAHAGSRTGLATAIGEQPIKGLLNPAAMARLALTEALTNLVFAPVTALPDVRASVNWMHAAKVRPLPLLAAGYGGASARAPPCMHVSGAAAHLAPCAIARHTLRPLRMLLVAQCTLRTLLARHSSACMHVQQKPRTGMHACS
jgi:phosphoribosylformylglycinamidine (FGAM) synthase-like enzyme